MGGGTRARVVARAERRSEPRFRAIFDAAGDAILIIDFDGRIREANRQACASLGHAREEILGMEVSRLGPGVDLEAARAFLAAHEPGRSVTVEGRLRRKNGTEFPAEIRATATDLDGERLLLVFARDVTARRAADEALWRAHHELHGHLTNTPLGVIAWDGDYRVTLFNGRAEEIFGWSAPEVMGRRVDEIPWVPDEEWPRVRAVMEAMHASSGATSVLANRNRRRDGRIITCEWYNSSLHGPDGKLASVFSLVHDVTGLEAARQQLQVASRLAALGTLVAGVAHEINNPLSGVTSGVVLASGELREARGEMLGGGPVDRAAIVHRLDEAIEMLGDAQSGAHRVARIVRELSAFGRPDPRRVRVALHEVVDDALQWLPASPGFTAALRVEREGKPEVLASPGQLKQVVLSLVTNAAQAIPAGRAGSVVVRVSAAEPGKAVLEVVDDGEGIPPERMERIFDPFFTTREVGQGTGLGLSVCHAIVTAHGGTVAATSAPGQGSTFRVELPAAPTPS